MHTKVKRPPPSLSLSAFCLRLCSLKDLSDCACYYYGMPLEMGGGTLLHSNHGCWGGGVDEGMGRDCGRGRDELTIMVCALQGNYVEWGRGKRRE